MTDKRLPWPSEGTKSRCIPFARLSPLGFCAGQGTEYLGDFVVQGSQRRQWLQRFAISTGMCRTFCEMTETSGCNIGGRSRDSSVHFGQETNMTVLKEVKLVQER